MPAARGYRELTLEQAQDLEGVWVSAGLADAPSVPPTPLGWDLALADVELLGDALERRGASLPRPKRRFVCVNGYAYHALVPLVKAARELLPTDALALAHAVACEALPAARGALGGQRAARQSLTLLAARIGRGLTKLEARVLAHERDASQHYRWLVEMDIGILPDDALKTTLAECLAVYRSSRMLEIEATLDLVGCHAALLALSRGLPEGEREHVACEALVPDALDLATATPSLALFSASRRARSENGALPTSSEFLSGFGERAAREREPHAPRWAEVPWLLDRTLMLLCQLDSRAFEARLARARQAREQRVAAALAAASRTDAVLLKLLVGAAQRSATLRARLHVVRSRALSMLRTVVLDMDRRLARLLGSAPEAGFFLRLEELLESTWRPDPRLSEVTRERHGVWRTACEQLAPPPVLGRAAVESGEEPLRGFGVGDATLVGAVTVANDFENALALEPGGVLVVRTLEPGWAPLLPLAGAIVTDAGGATSEGVLAAAALGIPLVVGTRRATRRLTAGVRVTVDTRRGSVELE
ncbi:MAG: PEP-utilizing enzyme [Myxococcota bacterium]